MDELERQPEHKFYVYEHWRTDKDQCFYVGKGFGNRAYSMRSRNRRHQFIQNRAALDGFEIVVNVVADCLSEEEAFRTEIELIEKWKALGAPLVNVTLGGGGSMGRVHTPEARAKMSASRKGKPKSRAHAAKLVAKLSTPEARKKANKKLTAMLKSPEHIALTRAWNTGKKRPLEMREAMRRAWTPERREARRIANIALNKILAERRAKTGAGASKLSETI